MFGLVMCLVFIIFKAEANYPETDIQEVRLRYTSNANDNFTVWIDKPLKIILLNGYARYIWCINYYKKNGGGTQNREIVPETKFNTDLVNVIHIPAVTAAMSTKWKCTVLQEYHGPATPYPYKGRNYTAKDLFFNVFVKGTRRVILTVNNRTLAYVTPHLSADHDGEAYYPYDDGEEMEFSCVKAQDDFLKWDTLRLEYFDANGTRLFQTKSQVIRKPFIFRSVLKKKSNNYYLECITANKDPEREHRYRTTFYLKKQDSDADTVQHPVILSVNDQQLKPLLNIDMSYVDYVFKYIDGEMLNVTCRKTYDSMGGSLSFYYDGNEIPGPGSTSAAISINITGSNINNKTLICGIKDTNVQKPNATLLFLSDLPEYEVRIRDLNRSNVLYQYTNNFTNWNIEYQFAVNDTLNLTCVSNKGFRSSQGQPNSRWRKEYPFQWKSKDRSFVSSGIALPTSKKIVSSSYKLAQTLNATHDGSKIQCIFFIDHDFNKSVDIVLRMKAETVSGAESGKVTLDKDLVPMAVAIAITVGVIIAITTMICLIYWRKRTKRENLIENAYDNISNQNDSPIPAYPSQWEATYDDSHYTKIEEVVMQDNDNYSSDANKLYRMPYKRQSNTSENHYTEIDEYIKPKSDGLAVAWNSAHPSKHNKEKDTTKSTYDRLRHNNVPVNEGNDNYSIVRNKRKNKSVTFRQMSNEIRPERNCSPGNSRQYYKNDDSRKNIGEIEHYANIERHAYKQPEDQRKKINYENNVLQNAITDNSLDLDYAEPYSEIGVSCRNDLYG